MYMFYWHKFRAEKKKKTTSNRRGIMAKTMLSETPHAAQAVRHTRILTADVATRFTKIPILNFYLYIIRV